MMLNQYLRPGRLWYAGDGFIWDDLPVSYRVEGGRPLECSSKLYIFNPQGKAASVNIMFYHIDRPPTGIETSVEPGSIETIELSTLPQIPHRQSFWIAVESDTPVLPQSVHADYTFWDQVPDALVSVAPYPGPLEDETRWVYPDCYQGGPKSWYERETLTILNPNKELVKAHIRYLLRGREPGAEERIEIPGKRVAQLDVWERNPRLLGTENGPPVRVIGDYAVRIDATGPIVTQTTRRARWTGRPSVVGARSTMGFPLRGGKQDIWYYPGGGIIDRGLLPRNQNCDVTWNLLFINNLDDKQKAMATIKFHYSDGTSATSNPIDIPPLKSDLQWLHLGPWLGKYTRIGEPWAMTVTSGSPVVPEVTCAEFEMWSQVCPGAMSAANFYPGPLDDERTWWLGIGQAGGSDEAPAEWEQTYHLFNPGSKPVHINLSFVGFITYSFDVSPGAARWVNSSDVQGLPLNQPFVVKADGDGPFCAQVFVRAFTRGLPYTRAMYSMIGVPMKIVEQSD